MQNYHEVDMEKKGRKEISDMFASFTNPNCSVCSRMDVSKVAETSKKTDTSIFTNTMYLISLALNEIEEFRYRYLDGKIVCFEKANVAWTVMTKAGFYKNCYMEFYDDYQTFYKAARHNIELTENNVDDVCNKNNPKDTDLFYYSCLPWVDFTSVSHPLPLGNLERLSVPRIVWGKFDKNYKMPVDICVCHAIMDGREIANAFENIQKKFDSAGSLLTLSRI